jgi:hypothetical protein
MGWYIGQINVNAGVQIRDGIVGYDNIFGIDIPIPGFNDSGVTGVTSWKTKTASGGQVFPTSKLPQVGGIKELDTSDHTHQSDGFGNAFVFVTDSSKGVRKGFKMRVKYSNNLASIYPGYASEPPLIGLGNITILTETPIIKTNWNKPVLAGFTPAWPDSFPAGMAVVPSIRDQTTGYTFVFSDVGLGTPGWGFGMETNHSGLKSFAGSYDVDLLCTFSRPTIGSVLMPPIRNPRVIIQASNPYPIPPSLPLQQRFEIVSFKWL